MWKYSSTLSFEGWEPWEDSLCAVLLNLSEPTLVEVGWAPRESSPRVEPFDFSELDIMWMKDVGHLINSVCEREKRNSDTLLYTHMNQWNATENNRSTLKRANLSQRL